MRNVFAPAKDAGWTGGLGGLFEVIPGGAVFCSRVVDTRRVQRAVGVSLVFEPQLRSPRSAEIPHPEKNSAFNLARRVLTGGSAPPEMLSQRFSEMRHRAWLQARSILQQSTCNAVVLVAKRVLQRAITVSVRHVNVGSVRKQKLNSRKMMTSDSSEQRRAMPLIEVRNVGTGGNPLSNHVQVSGACRKYEQLMDREHGEGA
jgi:hypothetical protein